MKFVVKLIDRLMDLELDLDLGKRKAKLDFPKAKPEDKRQHIYAR